MSRKKIIELSEMEQIQNESRKADMQMKMTMASKLSLYLKMPLRLGEITPKILGISKEIHAKLKERVETIRSQEFKYIDDPTVNNEFNKFTYMVIRETLMEYYIEKNEIPTRETLIVDLEQKTILCHDDSLNAHLKLQGFIWRKLPGTKKCILTEDPKRVIGRHRYFKKVKQYRNEDRPIYYIEESKFRVREPEGVRDIHHSTWVLTVFTENNLITSYIYVYPTDEDSEDLFHIWIKEKLLPKLVNNSVIVIEEKLNNEKNDICFPNEVNSKEEMKEWLNSKNVVYDETMCKAELMSLLNKFTKESCSKLEELFRMYGHEVLRRQKDFPNLSALTSVKKYVEGAEMPLNTIIKLTDILKGYTEEQWKRMFDGIKLEEKTILHEDLLLDNIVDKLMTMTAREGLKNDCSLDDYERDLEDYVVEKKYIRPLIFKLSDTDNSDEADMTISSIHE